MKSLSGMDLEEWELLPDDGFLEIHDDGGKKIYSRKYSSGLTSVLETNYFVCPTKSSPQFVESTTNQLLPVPIHLEPTILKPCDQEIPNQVPVEVKMMPSVLPEKIKPLNTGSASEADEDLVSQVFFKKMKEPEFVDMKVESPKSSRSGIMPQIEGTGFYQFEENGEAYKVEALDGKSCASKVKGDSDMDMEENNWGLNIWKWSLNGVGAIFSFGVAAATVSFIIFGSHQRSKQQNQKLQLQIYTNDKRIEQVVHHASKLNEAISAVTVRGVPLTRAHVTSGGYYEAH
ncbi:uncharacterized protein LOC111380208 [Olea europaea var. sylvestris]|uniref:uncharacterized protein LOC111380208 n=1 Tax=Olea europaea var. sylvestris TaxID=158386 RepID=UPI000C1D686F|nr:uncharacterized protein LOC111380208 [Olea europaea var. sylvestris]